MKDVDILLVEDSPDDLEMTLHALRSGRVANRIEVARDGAEAIEILFGGGVSGDRLREGGPRVILLDLKLPKVDGMEVLRRIKSDPRTHDIPVVMLTSSQEHSDIAECYALGVNSFIVKPVSFDLFVKAVQELGMYWLLLNKPRVVS